MSGISAEILAFIEEMVRAISGVSASPGFTWGGSGNISAGSFLQNDTVPSNRTGRMVPLVNGEITNVFVACEDPATFTIELLKKNGGSFISLTTMTMTNQRLRTEIKTGVSVGLNDEIACRVLSGSCKNPVVGVIIKGTSV